jgi:hypothetical protein
VVAVHRQADRAALGHEPAEKKERR